MDKNSQKALHKTIPEKKVSHWWASLPRDARVLTTVLAMGVSTAAVATFVYNVWVEPVREIYSKSEGLLDLIRSNDDLIYWLCTAHATTTEEYKLKSAFYPLLEEYQNDRKKQLLELISLIAKTRKIGTYAATSAANKLAEFENWHWNQYKIIASTNGCPTSNVLDGIAVHKWENEILQSMPYNISEFIWFYFEGFWKKDEEKQENSPQEKKP